MNVDNITTALYTYNSSIFSAYFDGKIIARKLPDNWMRYTQNSKPYTFKSDNILRCVTNMVGYKGILYLSSSNEIKSIDLKNKLQTDENLSKYTKNCTMLNIDFNAKILKAASLERGIVFININKPKKLEFLKELEIDMFKNSNLSIVGMESSPESTFISVRNLGIVKIDNENGNIEKAIIKDNNKKILLEDPQGVKFNKRNQLLYIIDSEKGLILSDPKHDNIIYQNKLPNEDSPKNIFLLNHSAIIQGYKGLYMFMFGSRKFKILLETKTGAITKYYNKIIYNKEGQLNLLMLDNKSNKEISYLKEYEIFENIYLHRNGVTEKVDLIK